MSEKERMGEKPASAASRGREAPADTIGSPRPSRGVVWLLAALLLVVVIATYLNHFDNSFHFDDAHVIEENVYIRDLGNVPLFFTDPATASTLPPNRVYRPLLLVTLAVDYALAGGLEPFWFHLSTFLWFLLQGALMVVLYLGLIERARPHPWNPVVALLMTGWFMLHPAVAETVNYVVQRADALSTLCVVAGLVIDLKARSWRRHLAWIPVVLAILIKSPAAMFVPLVFLQRLLFEEEIGWSDLGTERGRRALGRQVVRILPGAFLVGVVFWITMAMTPESWVPGGESRWLYLITQPFVMLRYFGLFFLPIALTADSDWTPLASVLDVRFFAGVTFIAIAVAAALWASNRRALRPIAYGLLWFFVALVPSSSIIPLAEVTNDHRMYFPFVGLTLAVGWGLGLLAIHFRAVWTANAARRWSVAAIVVLLLAGCAWGARVRNEVWHDDESLWYDVTLKSPRNGRGLMNYGLTRLVRGDYVTAERYFERARDTDYGRHPYVFVNLALAKEGLGRSDEADSLFQEALGRSTGFPAVRFFYASWLHRKGRDTEALRELDLVLRESPGYEGALQLREEIGSGELALADARAAVEGAPTPEGFLGLSLRLYQAGELEESIEASRRALELRPGYAEAHNNICAAHNALERWDQAIAACQEALRLKPDFTLARNNLNWALQNQGAGTP
jgi:Flp pilus assembly protein TadD